MNEKVQDLYGQCVQYEKSIPNAAKVIENWKREFYLYHL